MAHRWSRSKKLAMVHFNLPDIGSTTIQQTGLDSDNTVLVKAIIAAKAEFWRVWNEEEKKKETPNG
jgi:hypothetical protein